MRLASERMPLITQSPSATLMMCALSGIWAKRHLTAARKKAAYLQQTGHSEGTARPSVNISRELSGLRYTLIFWLRDKALGAIVVQ